MKSNGIITAAAVATMISFGFAPGVAKAQDGPGQHGAGQQPVHGHVQTGAENIMQLAVAHQHHEWARGIEATGWGREIGDRPVTLLMAPDAAFGQVPEATRHGWQTDPAAHRAAVGTSIIEGRHTLAELRQRDHVMTLTGERLPVRVSGNTVMIGDATIVGPDVAPATGQAIVHFVDRVLLPHQHMQQQPMQQQPMQQQPMQQPAQQQPMQQPAQQQPMQPAQQQPAQQPMQPTQQQPVREPVRKW